MGSHGVLALPSQCEVFFRVPTGALLQGVERERNDHREVHSMTPPTTQCDYQHALTRMRFQREQWDATAGYQRTDAT
eukprot:6006020-Pyramimonas_sp.AAC.1